MQHCHLIAKTGLDLLDHLGGQGDFRHQHQSVAAIFQGLADGVEVDLRLPAAGHAFQQESLALFSRDVGTDCLIGLLLLIV